MNIEGDGFKSLTWYKNQIQLWRRTIQINEETKYLAASDRESIKQGIISSINENFVVEGDASEAGKRLRRMVDKFFFENISFDAGVGSIEKSVETGVATAWEYAFSTDVSLSLGYALGVNFGGAGLEAVFSNSSAYGYGYDENESVEENIVYSYTLQDNDDYNKLSIDILNVMDGNGPVFILKGGKSSCPVEEAQNSYFYNNTIQPVVEPIQSDLRNLEESESIELSAGTIGLEVPFIAVEKETVVGISEGDAAEFNLILRNDSVLKPDESEFLLYLDESSNPNNAITNLGESGRVFQLEGSETVEFTLTIKKGASDVYKYDDIEIVFESICDDENSMSVTLSAEFIESCSRVNILKPSDNWVKNNLNTIEEDRNIPLSIVLNEFNLDFEGFEKVNLEYRQSGTANWTRLHTYVVSQTIFDEMILDGESEVSTITQDALEITYNWDIKGQSIADGDYELRAKSYCSNGVVYTSEVINGKVDLTDPTLFGTPQPTNGILTIGNDLIARFSEPIKENGSLTRYEFLVQKNQDPVNHEVSLAFNGSTNTAKIENPYIKSGNFAIEFWLKNQTKSNNGILLSQEKGLRINIGPSLMEFIIGEEKISTAISNDDSWHHYALSYNSEGQLVIIEDDDELKTLAVTEGLNFDNNNPIIIGGNDFIGNLHDLRIWKKFISREDAVSSQNNLLNGKEMDLVGYWPMNEGHGKLANDLSRFKHMTLDNVGWDIFPKGTSYRFNGNEYLTFTEASKVIISKQMDATVSFWMKTNQTSKATLISNGKGDATDLITSNNYRNKWSFGINELGQLEFKAENNTYHFGSQKVNDDEWHHISMVVRRNGNLNMFIDGHRVATSNVNSLGGFSGSSIILGARGQIQNDGILSVDQYYDGFIDEFRIWNTSKDEKQIEEDQFFEADYKSLGLIFYVSFNKPETSTSNGPRYYYPLNSLEKLSATAELSVGSSINYSNTTPPLKPIRPVERLNIAASINEDEVFLTPYISDWASIENKIAYVTVANLYDLSDNRLQSPITWTAYINKNPLNWFIEGEGSKASFVMEESKSNSFEITVQNLSGIGQAYTIIKPDWIEIFEPTGVIPPSGIVKLNAKIDANVATGIYEDQLVLTSNYSYNETIDIKLEVRSQEPNWNFSPNDFEQSMTILGKLKIDNVYSNDINDKIIAYIDDQVRGVAGLAYDNDYDDYFLYLTVYGNPQDNSEIIFKIWDASVGRLKEANIDSSESVVFNENALLGRFSDPKIFNNNGQEGQEIIFNSGWTWVSFNVKDSNFSDLNTLFESLELYPFDRILSNGPARFDMYESFSDSPTKGGWFGTISTSNGLTTDKMYKVKLAKGQNLLISGEKVDLNKWSFQIEPNWNWLPYVVDQNAPINSARANFYAEKGDLIKSQTQFAIYDGAANGWKGSLEYLYKGEGYMLNASSGQTFSYAEYLNNHSKRNNNKEKLRSPVLRKEFAGFSSNMNLIGRIPHEFDGIKVYNENNDLVGICQINEKENYHNRIVFATIYGTSPENYKVVLTKDEKEGPTPLSFVYEPDTIYGSLDEPVDIEEDILISATLNAAPNPFKNYINITFDATTSGKAKIHLFDINNREINTLEIFVTKGDNTVSVEIDNTPMGTYVLQLHFNGVVYSKLLVKN